MDCSPPGSSVHGLLQARILEGVAISFPGDLSAPGIKSASSPLAGRFFTAEPLWKPIHSKAISKPDNIHEVRILLLEKKLPKL